MHSPKPDRLWSPSFSLTVLAYTLISISNYMLVAVLPSRLLGMGGSPVTAGLVVGIFSFTALFFRPVCGHLMDRIGRKPVLMAGCLMFCAGTVLQFVLPSLALILACRALQGIGFSGVTTSAGVILTDVSPPGRITEGLGWLQMANAVNFAAGPALGMVLSGTQGPGQTSDWLAFYAVLGTLTSLACMLTLGIRYEKKHPPVAVPDLAAGNSSKPDGEPVQAAQGTADVPSGLQAFPLRRILALAATNLLFMVSMGCVVTFVPLYAKALQMPQMTWFFAIYAGASLLGIRVIAVRLPQHWGQRRVLVFGGISSACGMLGLFALPSLPAILACAVLYGLGFAASQTLILSSMMQLCPPDRRGIANALNFAALDIAMSAGPVLAGLLVQAAGLPWVFLMAGISILAGLCNCLFWCRRYPPL